MVGYMFVLMNATYTVVSPLVGMLAGRLGNVPMMLAGGLCSCSPCTAAAAWGRGGGGRGGQ